MVCLSPRMFVCQPWLMRRLDNFALLFDNLKMHEPDDCACKVCVFVLDLDYNPPRALVRFFRLHCLVKFYSVSLHFCFLQFLCCKADAFLQSALRFASSHSFIYKYIYIFIPPTLLISYMLPFLGMPSFRALLPSAIPDFLSAIGCTNTRNSTWCNLVVPCCSCFFLHVKESSQLAGFLWVVQGFANAEEVFWEWYLQDDQCEPLVVLGDVGSMKLHMCWSWWVPRMCHFGFLHPTMDYCIYLNWPVSKEIP